jgi:glutaconate CoA-transferase subunit B
MGVMEPDPRSRELVLTGIQEGVTVDEVRRATGWKLRVADDIAELSPPSLHELAVLRDLQARTKAAHGAVRST